MDNRSKLLDIALFKYNEDSLTDEVIEKCTKEKVLELLELPIFSYDSSNGGYNYKYLDSKVLANGNKEKIKTLLEMPIFEYNKDENRANELFTKDIILYSNIKDLLLIIVLCYDMDCMECIYSNPEVLLMKYKDLEVRMISLMDNDIDIVRDNCFNPLLFGEKDYFSDSLHKSYQMKKCM